MKKKTRVRLGKLSPSNDGRQTESSWLDAHVSTYANYSPSSNTGIATIGELLETMRTRRVTLQPKIKTLKQKWLATTGEEKRAINKTQHDQKKRLPCFTVSGVCRNGQRNNEGMIEHSGLLEVDIDNLVTKRERDRVFRQLKFDPYVGAVVRSVSEIGYKAMVRVPRDMERHKEMFEAVRDYLATTYGLQIDDCGDKARLWYHSYDPHLHINRAAIEFPLPEKREKKTEQPAAVTVTNDDQLGRARKIAQERLGEIGEWASDREGKTFFAQCECPRGHDDARIYLNRDGSLKLHCAGDKARRCHREVQFVNEWFKEKWNASAAIELPPIQNVADFIDREIILPLDVVEGVLHLGGKMVLGGGSKSFKTWQQLDVVVSVATGTEWLGFKTKQGRVLYLNFEIPELYFWKRIQDICRAKGVHDRIKASPLLDVWNLRGRATDLDALMPKILQRIETNEQQYALIDLDPIYKVLGRLRDENKASDIMTLLNGIESLAVKTGAAVLFGAHFSKGNQAEKESIDRISGSGVFGRDPDSILIFTKHAVENAFTVESILRNHSPQNCFAARWEFPLMKRDDSLDPADLRRGGRPATTDEGKMLSLLDPEGLTNAEWLRQAKDKLGIAETTFRRHRNKLKADKRIKKKDDKWYHVF